MFKEHNPGTLVAPFTQFAQGIETTAGRWLVISGQVAARPDASVASDIETQLDEVWGKILAILASAGMGPANLVRIGGFLTDRADVPAFREVRDRHLAGARPTSTLVIVNGLVDPRWRVEIEGLAVAP
jgi:2-iminobutanoate/2-iminopropanoate deaminase